MGYVMTFIENKYRKIYFNLVEHRKNNPLQLGEYGEFHHIIPKCLNGNDDSDNLVKLTPREHYIAHRLLIKITEGNAHSKMWWALHRMIHGNINPLSSKQYDKFRKEWSEWIKANHSSKTNPEWTENVSNAVKESWENNQNRKRDQGSRIRNIHNKLKKENSEFYYSRQKENAKKGAMAAKEVCSLRLEYNNNIYIGWDSLLTETGISKSLYNKFYKNYIDPKFRIGRDGPLTIDDIDHIISEYCYKTGEPNPVTLQNYIDILDRMIKMGMVSGPRVDKYLGQKFDNKRKEASA